jgi:dipeptidyl aminopeptidase/acylaminoacyl peptidase
MSNLVTAELLWKIERVGAPALSPDGTQAAASLTRYDAASNKAATSVWLLSTFGGTPRQLTAAGDKDAQPAWSPRGDAIAFVAKRDQQGSKDDEPQLYLIAPDGGEAQRISSIATGVGAFKWLPDGKRIVFVSWVNPQLKGEKAQADYKKARKERKDTAFVTEAAQYRFWDHNIEESLAPCLHVLDVKTGKSQNLFEGTAFQLSLREPDGNCFDVSPDGQHIAFVFDPAAQKRSDNVEQIVELNLKTRKPKIVATDKAWTYGAPAYSEDGSQLACIAQHLGKKHTAPDVLAVIDRASNTLQVASAAWDCAVAAPLKWHGSSVIFGAEENARKHLWQFDLKTRKPTRLFEGGYLQGFDAAFGQIVLTADAMDHPARAHALSLNEPEKLPKRIENFNDALLAKVKMGKTQSITYKGGAADGKNKDDVHMWVVYPPDFDAKKKYPLLHAIHGGPHAASADTFHYRWNNQAFAAQGYVVVCVNYHGSSSFGNAFLDSITHRWGELELADIEAATDVMLKKPYIDKNRLFATGGSYGGYMVAWMNGHLKTGRYQAYVCHAGCFDWVGMFSDDAWAWHAKELGSYYYNDMAKVHAQSPHAFAKNAKTPTLVIHGLLDYRVPDSQGLAYYNTLKSLQTPAKLIWFPDENHWILKPANSLLWYREFFDWLKRFDPKHTSGDARTKSPSKRKAAKVKP